MLDLQGNERLIIYPIKNNYDIMTKNYFIFYETSIYLLGIEEIKSCSN